MRGDLVRNVEVINIPHGEVDDNWPDEAIFASHRRISAENTFLRHSLHELKKDAENVDRLLKNAVSRLDKLSAEISKARKEDKKELIKAKKGAAE